MLLDWLDQRHTDHAATRAATIIEQAAARLLTDGRSLTADLGGAASTTEMADAVIAML
jgi:isocitrate/isopropylmalate dehydrogenase